MCLERRVKELIVDLCKERGTTTLSEVGEKLGVGKETLEGIIYSSERGPFRWDGAYGRFEDGELIVAAKTHPPSSSSGETYFKLCRDSEEVYDFWLSEP